METFNEKLRHRQLMKISIKDFGKMFKKSRILFSTLTTASAADDCRTKLCTCGFCSAIYHALSLSVFLFLTRSLSLSLSLSFSALHIVLNWE